MNDNKVQAAAIEAVKKIKAMVVKVETQANFCSERNLELDYLKFSYARQELMKAADIVENAFNIKVPYNDEQ